MRDVYFGHFVLFAMWKLQVKSLLEETQKMFENIRFKVISSFKHETIT